MQSDDRVIKEEGLDNLTDDELRSACRARGMRTPYGEGAVAFMRKQLQEWLDLSLNRYGSTLVHTAGILLLVITSLGHAWYVILPSKVLFCCCMGHHGSMIATS